MFAPPPARGRLWQAKRGDNSNERRGNSCWRHLANATFFRSAKNIHRHKKNNDNKSRKEVGRVACINYWVQKMPVPSLVMFFPEC